MVVFLGGCFGGWGLNPSSAGRSGLAEGRAYPDDNLPMRPNSAK